jgi:GNAT superfamily N-acetyltransferase
MKESNTSIQEIEIFSTNAISSCNQEEQGHTRRKAMKSQTASFYLVDDFYERADSLSAQFEKRISAAVLESAGMTPLVYAFCPDAFQYLTTSAEHLFARDLLDDLIERLRGWAKGAIGACSVSSPQGRIYIQGCRRRLVTDRCTALWHYMLSVTPQHQKKGIAIRLLSNGTDEDERTFNIQLKFNQLLVHRAECAYGIESKVASWDPIKGSIYLDGYLW